MATRTLNRLASRFIDTVKEEGLHADGGGLYLKVNKSGAKAWIFLYQRAGPAR